MKRLFFLLLCFFSITAGFAQNVSHALKTAFEKFLSDPQLRQAITSLYVADAATGAVVFAHNSEYGLAPASTQKLLTSATAYALLGRDFRYETRFGLIKNGSNNSLAIFPSGDPTLGSWRWAKTKEESVLQRINAALKKGGVSTIQTLVIYNKDWNEEGIPGSWAWDDIGNYYGAGAYGLNWRENQFDLLLRSGSKIGDAVSIVGTVPKLYDHTIISRVRAAAKGTGDRTLIYLPVLSREGVIRGTIPVGEQRFEVSGAMPNPQHQFAETLKYYLRPALNIPDETPALVLENEATAANIIHTETSPPLDSIIYWLNQKSVNLYAEALVKTIALRKTANAETAAGVDTIKEFWKSQGIPVTELNIQDGSGLSAQNRMTTKAQVAILLFAKKQPWYNGFYASLPLYNGMKMKSGTIGGVKGFTGYHTSKSGTVYAFSFLVNNYNGSSSALVQKMYAVLSTLK